MKSWQHENLHNYIQLELQAGPFTLHLSNFSCHRWALFPPRTPKEILKVPPSIGESQKDEAIMWFHHVYPKTQLPSWPQEFKPVICLSFTLCSVLFPEYCRCTE